MHFGDAEKMRALFKRFGVRRAPAAHGIKIQNRVSCEALKYGRVVRRGVNVAAAY
jgi:hypothetical protein